MVLRNSSRYVFLLSLFFLFGCVGTVQEAVPPDTLKIVNPPTTFNFSGITTARAISHSRVELEFFPAGGGPDVVYELYVNNSTTPLPIDTQSLSTVTGGRLLYTVQNLQTDKEYKFKLTAKNTRTAAISANENIAYARTFDNLVANFDGISKISLVAGDTDNAIKVDWIAPTMSGIFTAGPYDPVNYEVTVISETGGAGNLNNPMYTGLDKKVVLIPTPPAAANPLSNPSTTVIDGLTPGTRYYVQVRAINSLYRTYQEDATVTYIPVNREMNTKFLNIKTDNSGSLFDFRQDNVVVSNAKSSDAFDKIDVFWQAGSGSFTGYRIFVRKYDGIGDALIDDKLTDPVLTSMNSLGDYFSVSASLTNKRISGLDNGSFYQVKVALCKTITCPVNQADGNAAIISDLRAIKIQPTLAGFSGINSIEPPGQYNEKDVVKLKFDAPLVNDGFANEVEIYCVDPTDHSSMVKLSGTALAGNPIARCNGVFLDGAAGSLATYTSQKVKGLITDGTKEYCFAATPAIIGYGADVRLSVADRIVRCSYPEVFPPSVAQFPGLSGSCGVSATSGVVNWSLPTGGIYSGFKVFWKEKGDVDKFSYPQAIAGGAGYTSSPVLSATTQAYTATNLMPGRTYQIGVLAFVDFDPPATDLYSEYNLKILDCVVPLPIATFEGFSRIFAVGPKYDGRVPNDIASKAPSPNSSLYEAIDTNGTPFEIAMDSPVLPNPLTNFTPPPGRDYGANFNGGFDGAKEESLGMAISKDGIISLAWEDVKMSFGEADSLFVTNQPAPPALRTGRTWGYKVFRSSDNMLTWREMTTVSGPIYSTSYSYRKRPNGSLVPTRMAFFTDYSVKALAEAHDAALGRDVERARTYHYKIIPVFDGKALTYSRSKDHIVKITLPPPNMALVHRWMANRARCMEIDKDPVIAENYSCEYNGLGSHAKTIPYRVGATNLDQGGDLLIDRFELGCRYTRGDKVATSEIGSSYFKILTKRDPADDDIFPAFKGYRTVGTTVDTSTPFKGCVGSNSTQGATGTAADYPPGFSADYAHVLQGDCVGRHVETISRGTCSALAFANNELNSVGIIVPGAPYNPSTPPDCSQDTALTPTTMGTKYLGYRAPNAVMQSEFLAVYYNASSSSGRLPPMEGPTTGSLAATGNLNASWDTSIASSQCSINLAAIDGSGYMRPRWVSVNELGGNFTRFKNSYGNLLNKTVNQISEVTAQTVQPLAFYNGTEGDGTTAAWKLPGANLRNSNRYRGTTPIGKVLYSNSSKLPPLGKLNAEIAKNVCATFYVQTGVASDNGNFSPDSQPVKKRLLRRIESIAASAWPDTFDTAQVSDVETGATGGSCNTPAKSVTSAIYNKGSTLSNVPFMNAANTPLVTGSSNYVNTVTTTDARHTSRCVSRYGVQDMVGNLMENNSEKFFCDYSQDAIFLGPVTGTWSGGTGAINTGNGGPDYNFFNNNTQRAEWAVLKSGTMADGSSSNFQYKFRDGSPARTDLKPWVRISVDSGYCSPVDTDPLRRDGTADVFKDIATGYWSPLYMPGGALNSSMIAKAQYDQEGVATLRNGDGRFLDFGPRGIAAPLNHANTLALSGGSAQSKYFNPVLGIPLLCENGACNDPLIPTPNDNTSITTPGLAGNITGADDPPTITNFWTGSSQITHSGISDFNYSPSGVDIGVAPISGGYGSAPPFHLSAVVVDDPVTMGNPVQEVKQFPGDFLPGSTLEYYRVVWDVDRGAEFAMASGGKSNQTTTGRYTASVNRSTIGSYILGTGADDVTSGGRCVIMINQDP
jgi:hypothetical protein